jgi:transcriptional regulator with XRE-family HTH domain
MWQICHCGCYMLFQSSHMHPDKAKIVAAVGEMMRDLRTSRNLTIEELANMTGLEYSQISRIERGKINTSVLHLLLIIHTLQVSHTQLLRHLIKYLPPQLLRILTVKPKNEKKVKSKLLKETIKFKPN